MSDQDSLRVYGKCNSVQKLVNAGGLKTWATAAMWERYWDRCSLWCNNTFVTNRFCSLTIYRVIFLHIDFTVQCRETTGGLTARLEESYFSVPSSGRSEKRWVLSALKYDNGCAEWGIGLVTWPSLEYCTAYRVIPSGSYFTSFSWSNRFVVDGGSLVSSAKSQRKW